MCRTAVQIRLYKYKLGHNGESMTKVLAGYSLQFALVSILLCGHSGVCAQESPAGARQSPRTTKESWKYAELLRFVSVSSKDLPDHVQLVKRIGIAPFLVTRNPDVIVDPHQIKFLAAFFGIRDKSDLQPVHAGVVAIYQEKEPANEIGVYGLYFSDKKAAERSFNKLMKSKKHPPYFLKGALLVCVWKDPGVSNSAFEEIRDYFKAAKLPQVDRERDGS